MTTVLAAGCVLLAALCAVLALRLRRALRKIRYIRQVAQDHDGYIPDDLINRPNSAVFARASSYWSVMMSRVINDDMRHVVLRAKSAQRAPTPPRA